MQTKNILKGCTYPSQACFFVFVFLPDCAVCSSGYSGGISNGCHHCSEAFKAGMFFLATVGFLMALAFLWVLFCYLVSSAFESLNIVRSPWKPLYGSLNLKSVFLSKFCYGTNRHTTSVWLRLRFIFIIFNFLLFGSGWILLGTWKYRDQQDSKISIPIFVCHVLGFPTLLARLFLRPIVETTTTVFDSAARSVSVDSAPLVHTCSLSPLCWYEVGFIRCLYDAEHM